jgi:thiol-disulfide isomerase/thioredoxin
MKQYLILVLAFIIINSCTEIPLQINEVVISPTNKVVVIEELTGPKCPNCPKATKTVENIIEKYPDNVIAVNIHGNLLADPAKPGDPDFRNEDAKNLELWFKPWFGKPAASINRIQDNDMFFVRESIDLYQSEVEKELEKPLEMNLFMGVEYDENTRKIDIEVTANPVVDLSGEYNITVYILESHIIAAQYNGTDIITDYEHNHVLRKCLTNFTGDFFAKDMSKGQILRQKFSYVLPQVDGKLNHAEHTSVVAFIHKSGFNTRDIIQGVSKYIVK